MYGKKYTKNRTKGSKALKKAMWSATKKEDKLQNKAIMSLQKQVKKLNAIPEIKIADNDFQQIQFDYTGGLNGLSTQQLSLIGAGTGATSDDGNILRIGNVLRPLHIHIRGTVGSYSSTNTNTPWYSFATPFNARCIIFQYLEDESVAPFNSSLLLENPADVNSLREATHLKSFKVLYDHTYICDQNTPSHKVNIYKRVSRKIYFKGQAYNDNTNNTIYMLWISDFNGQAGPPSFGSQYSVNARLTFTDD